MGWLMPLGWLTNSELNKNTPEAKRRPSVLLKPKSSSLRAGWLKPMRLLPREAAVPWPSLNLASGSLRLNSEAYKAFQKAERRVKELQFQQDEDHKNQDRMSEL